MVSFFKHIKLVSFNCRAESVFLPMFFSFIFFWSFSWNIFAKQQPAQRRKLFLCSDKAEIFDDQPLNSWHSKIVWEYVSVFTQINTCSSHCQIKEICLRILTAPGFKKGKHCRQSGENEAHDFGEGPTCVIPLPPYSLLFLLFSRHWIVFYIYTHARTQKYDKY